MFGVVLFFSFVGPFHHSDIVSSDIVSNLPRSNVLGQPDVRPRRAFGI
jgi:hypothetical protein